MDICRDITPPYVALSFVGKARRNFGRSRKGDVSPRHHVSILTSQRTAKNNIKAYHRRQRVTIFRLLALRTFLESGFGKKQVGVAPPWLGT